MSFCCLRDTVRGTICGIIRHKLVESFVPTNVNVSIDNDFKKQYHHCIIVICDLSKNAMDVETTNQFIQLSYIY